MEKCYQCKNEFEQLPVVLVVSPGDVSDEDKPTAIGQEIGANGDLWLAMPICAPCHQQPTVSGHFFFRQDMPVGLKNAGSTTLGG